MSGLAISGACIALGVLWLGMSKVYAGMREMATTTPSVSNQLVLKPKESADDEPDNLHLEVYSRWVRLRSAMRSNGATPDEIQAAGEKVVKRIIQDPRCQVEVADGE